MSLLFVDTPCNAKTDLLHNYYYCYYYYYYYYYLYVKRSVGGVTLSLDLMYVQD